MRTVIFDLDGTLADTSRDLIAAANVCFRDLGLGDLLDPLADAGTALRGAKAMLTLGFSRVEGFGAEEIDRQYPRLVAAYAADIDRHSVLYPGAMAAVGRLRAAGYGVGICTNKPEALAQSLLTRLGVRDSFGALVGADTLAQRKPDPAPLREAVCRLGGDMARTCLVGDTVTDHSTARAAGVPSVLVTFGPGGGDMAALAPDALLDHFDDLDRVLAGLGL